MEKETIIKVILDVCKNMGLEYDTKVKGSTWNADVVIKKSTYKIAFNICKSPRNIEYTRKAMRDERVCGCWLLLPAKNPSYHPPHLPCFPLISHLGKELVCLNTAFDEITDEQFELTEFLCSIINGNIKFTENAEIDKVELCFYTYDCWKCHKENDLFFINRLFTKEGKIIDGHLLDEEITFNPSIIQGLKKYIKERPSETFVMGEIKPRYSKTAGESYPSFGCIQCDSIFGNLFLQDIVMELMYDTDSLRKAIIPLDESIKVHFQYWYKVKT